MLLKLLNHNVILIVSFILAFVLGSLFTQPIENKIYIPVFQNNHDCIYNYFQKTKFKLVKGSITNFPFVIETPSSRLIGLIEISDIENINQDVFKGLKYSCYNTKVIEASNYNSLNWDFMTKDIKEIYLENKYNNVDKNKPIYVEINNEKNTYSVYQDGLTPEN